MSDYHQDQLILTNAELVKSLLDVLLASMQSDCPPSKKAIEDTVLIASMTLARQG